LIALQIARAAHHSGLRLVWASRRLFVARQINLVEYPAVREMCFLGLPPAAEDFVDGQQPGFTELFAVLLQETLNKRIVMLTAKRIIPLSVWAAKTE
jgi:hypothetical protein